MRTITLILLLFVTSVAFGQRKIKVHEEREKFSTGTNNSLVASVYESTPDDIEKAWKKLMKDYGAKMTMKKEIFADDASIKDLSPNTCDIYAFVRKISDDENEIVVGAGTLISKLCDFCIDYSLSGFEWAGGLPGTVGGAVRGNAGAFGKETKDNVVSVTSLNLKTLDIVKRSNQECSFSYRSSIFKTIATDEVIISAVLGFKNGNKEEIEKSVKEKVEFRKSRHPLENPNAGSVFKNVPFDSIQDQYKNELQQYVKNDPFPVVPSAKMIFLAGLKGKWTGQRRVCSSIKLAKV